MKFEERSLANMKEKYFVYILKCNDGKPYTGYTENLDDRLNRHHRGSVPAPPDEVRRTQLG